MYFKNTLLIIVALSSDWCNSYDRVANAFVASTTSCTYVHRHVANSVHFQCGYLLKSTKESTEFDQNRDIAKVAYVVNLSYDTTASTLYDKFGAFGTVEQVFMPRNKAMNKSKGIAFVTMSSQEERDAAISGLNETDVDGRKVYVDKAKPRGEIQKVEKTKLYIGNISFDTTAEDLQNAFGKFGDVSSIYLPTDRETGEARGFAFLAMSKADAKNAIKTMNGSDFLGRQIEVSESLPRGSKAPSRKNEVKIYVGNLSFGTKEEAIREMFKDYGPLIDVYVPVDDDTGLGRGFAFVTVLPEQSEKAIGDFDGYELDGRILRVNEAQPRGFNSKEAW